MIPATMQYLPVVCEPKTFAGIILDFFEHFSVTKEFRVMSLLASALFTIIIHQIFLLTRDWPKRIM